jgi:hypothetical protein
VREFRGAVLEETEIMTTTKIALNFMEQNGHQNYMVLKIIALIANDIARQRYELSKQLQDLHIDVALFSETHL